MNESQKKTTQEYLDNYDSIFKKQVKVESNVRGTGGVYLITGSTAKEVYEKAISIKDGIDPYRSPVVSGVMRTPQGEWYAEVSYYGLD